MDARYLKLAAVGTAAGAFSGLFGVGGGVLFTLLHDRLRPPGPTILYGVCFGLAVWAVSYQGWIPKLGILPAAHRDRPGRRRTMVVGHVLYGAVLGLVAKGRTT